MTKHATYLWLQYRGWIIERKNNNDENKVTITKSDFTKSFEDWSSMGTMYKKHSLIEALHFIDTYEDVSDELNEESK